MENQNIDQEILPKPQTDLPLPEKEIPEHATPASQGKTPQSHPNSKLKWILIILGILEIPLPAFFLFSILPNLISINNNVGANSLSSYFGIGFFAVLLLVAVSQLITGLLSLESRFGKIKTKVLISSGIILSLLAIPVIILSVIYPIYNSVSKITVTPSISPAPTSNIYPEGTRSATANWKTYENKELNLVFKYPNDYKLENDGFFYPSELPADQQIENSSLGSISIQAVKNSSFSKCNIIRETYQSSKITSTDNQEIDGIKTIKDSIETNYSGEGGGFGELFINNYCFIKNYKIFTFSMFFYNKIADEDKKLFNQILSTFRFD